MKLLMPCMACFQELGKPTNEFVTLEFHDDGHYEVCCSRGHTSVTILQQQKFEILFDIGLMQLLMDTIVKLFHLLHQVLKDSMSFA